MNAENNGGLKAAATPFAEQQQIVLRAQQGDRDAAGLLYDTYTPKLFGYLMNTLRDRTRAEDVLQTTWVKALDALPRFQFRGAPFSSWLFAIARNVCREQWRSGAREVPLEPEHDRADDREQTDTMFIERILAALNEPDRELIRLRFIADLQTSEIARVIGVSGIAVRVRLHRVIKKIQKYVQS